MTVLDQLLDFLPVASKKAVAAASPPPVLLHPAAVPASVRPGALAFDDASAVDDGKRVVAILGPGASFDQLAAALRPIYTKAGVTVAPDTLARALLFYSRNFLDAGSGWTHHKVGVCLPLPIEIDGTGWIVDGDKIRAWAKDKAVARLLKRQASPPTPLSVPEPAQIEGAASAALALDGTAAGLWEQVVRNPYDSVLLFFAFHRLQAPATNLSLALQLLETTTTKDHQLKLLATTSAGNAILRRLEQALAFTGPLPPDATSAKITAAKNRLDGVLRQGPAGARTLVPHRELPETASFLDARPGSARAVPGAKADPAGGLHCLVLGRDVAVGRAEQAVVAGTTFVGPAFAGRLELDAYLQDDAAGLQAATGVADLPARVVMIGVDGVKVREPAGALLLLRQPDRLDAVKARDDGVLRIGLAAWSALDPDGLAGLLSRFKDEAGTEFDLYFALHRLDVIRDPAHGGQPRLAKIGDNGQPTVMSDDAIRAFFGQTIDAKGVVRFGSEWAARFRLAALASRRWRRNQVVYAAGQLTPDRIDLATASVSPFPSAYRLDIDPVKSPPLEAALDAELLDHPPAVGYLHGLKDRGIKSHDTLAGAVVDLSGGPGVLPAYAGFEDEETFFVGSMGKMPAMYAAFELRHRVNKAAAAVKASIAAGAPAPAKFLETLFLARVPRIWGPRVAKGFPGLDTKMPDRFPKLGEIFTVSPAGVVDFTHGTASDATIAGLDVDPLPTDGSMKFREFLKSMIFMSNAHAAGEVITAVGYPYLNGVLREAGFFDARTKRGIWLSGSYDDRDWVPRKDVMELSPRGKRHYAPNTNFVGNAKQFARLLTLMDRHLLFDADVNAAAAAVVCEEMKDIMRKDHRAFVIDNSFVRLAVDFGLGGPHVDTWASKIGIGVVGPAKPKMKGHHDCAVIERKKPDGTALRYVLVMVGGLVDATLPRGTPDPQTGGYFGFISILDRAVANAH